MSRNPIYQEAQKPTSKAASWLYFGSAVVIFLGLAAIGTAGLIAKALPATPVRVGFVWVCAFVGVWLFWRTLRRELREGSATIRAGSGSSSKDA